MATMKTPKPKPLKIVCTECGMDWAAHGDKPTLADCVRLLKAELAKPRPNVYGQSIITPAQYRTIN